MLSSPEVRSPDRFRAIPVDDFFNPSVSTAEEMFPLDLWLSSSSVMSPWIGSETAKEVVDILLFVVDTAILRERVPGAGFKCWPVTLVKTAV